MTNLIFEQSPQRLVLVVDDDADIRDMIQLMLVNEGYAVAAASSHQEAESYLAVSKPSVLVMDYLLPNADCGKKMARTALGRLPNAAKVLMTCVPNADQIATQLGIEYSIQKPFDPDHFLTTVREALADKFPD
jgi:CheY-like chemotaxis protein